MPEIHSIFLQFNNHDNWEILYLLLFCSQISFLFLFKNCDARYLGARSSIISVSTFTFLLLALNMLNGYHGGNFELCHVLFSDDSEYTAAKHIRSHSPTSHASGICLCLEDPSASIIMITNIV